MLLTKIFRSATGISLKRMAKGHLSYTKVLPYNYLSTLITKIDCKEPGYQQAKTVHHFSHPHNHI